MMKISREQSERVRKASAKSAGERLARRILTPEQRRRRELFKKKILIVLVCALPFAVAAGVPKVRRGYYRARWLMTPIENQERRHQLYIKLLDWCEDDDTDAYYSRIRMEELIEQRKLEFARYNPTRIRRRLYATIDDELVVRLSDAAEEGHLHAAEILVRHPPIRETSQDGLNLPVPGDRTALALHGLLAAAAHEDASSTVRSCGIRAAAKLRPPWKLLAPAVSSMLQSEDTQVVNSASNVVYWLGVAPEAAVDTYASALPGSANRQYRPDRYIRQAFGALSRNYPERVSLEILALAVEYPKDLAVEESLHIVRRVLKRNPEVKDALDARLTATDVADPQGQSRKAMLRILEECNKAATDERRWRAHRPAY